MYRDPDEPTSELYRLLRPRPRSELREALDAAGSPEHLREALDAIHQGPDQDQDAEENGREPPSARWGSALARTHRDGSCYGSAPCSRGC